MGLKLRMSLFKLLFPTKKKKKPSSPSAKVKRGGYDYNELGPSPPGSPTRCGGIERSTTPKTVESANSLTDSNDDLGPPCNVAQADEERPAECAPGNDSERCRHERTPRTVKVDPSVFSSVNMNAALARMTPASSVIAGERASAECEHAPINEVESVRTEDKRTCRSVISVDPSLFSSVNMNAALAGAMGPIEEMNSPEPSLPGSSPEEEEPESVTDFMLNYIGTVSAPPSFITAGKDGTGNGDKENNATPMAVTPTTSRKRNVTFQFSQRGEEARLKAIERSRKILSKASLRLNAIDTTSNQMANEPLKDGVYHSQYLPHNSGSSSRSAINREKRFGSSGGGARSSSAGQLRGATAVESHTVGEEGHFSSIVFYEKGSSFHSQAQAQQHAQSTSSEKENMEMKELLLTEPQHILMPSKEEEGSAVVCPLSTTDSAAVQIYAVKLPSFFIVCLCPKLRIFEFVEINNSSDSSKDVDYIESPNATIGEVLSIMSKKCIDKRLSAKKYAGLVRPSDRTEFVALNAPAFSHDADGGALHHEETVSSFDTIHQDDVLVAIIDSYTGYQTAKISKPILKNAKFRDMIRRRRKVNDGELYNRKSGSSRRNKSSSNRSVSSRSSCRPPSICDDDSSVPSCISSAQYPPHSHSRRSSRRCKKSKNNKKYSTLCQKLEDLSRVLHEVDDEIVVDCNEEESVVVTGDVGGAVPESGGDLTTIGVVPTPTNLSNFKMTPHMVALELASNIEDIFADHSVEIVAVEASAAEDDDADGMPSVAGGLDDDDDSFVTARSRRSIRPPAVGYKGRDKEIALPTVLEFKPKKERNSRCKFDNFEESDLMLQIEAMAAEADAAFESRNTGRKKSGGTVVIEGKRRPEVPSKTSAEESAMPNALAESKISKCKISFDADEEIKVSPDDAFDTHKSITKATSSSPLSNMEVSTYTPSQEDAMSRDFLNTSTSMVSSMVAASRGRVNEVHVLQYLGMSIVCIAANFVQSARHAAGGGARGMPGGGRGMNGDGGGRGEPDARELMQSAMFLAFIVNGQRYLAKVTKK